MTARDRREKRKSHGKDSKMKCRNLPPVPIADERPDRARSECGEACARDDAAQAHLCSALRAANRIDPDSTLGVISRGRQNVQE
jgi:hypothetical protein